MELTSYGKCASCKRYSMLVCFWFFGDDSTPMYLCKDCHKELDDAMAAYLDEPICDEEW